MTTTETDERTGRDLSAESRGEAPGRGRLRGRRILVVGGGQAAHGGADGPVGNGRAMSILFGREGAAVAVADRDAASAEETAVRVRAEGASAVTLAVDATDEQSVIDLVAAARDELGGLDGLVLNVGTDGGHYLEGTTLEQWQRNLTVNATTAFLGAKHGAPALEPGGSLLMVSSTSAFSPAGGVPAMSAAKAALGGLLMHIAKEQAPRGVRANIVAPGLIDTPLGLSGGRKRADRGRIEIPMGRKGTAWDVAYTAAFLLSDEAAYITGQTLVVDGGRLIG